MTPQPNSAAEFVHNLVASDQTLKATDWLPFCTISVPSGRLCATDPMLFPGLVVAVPKGRYDVHLTLCGTHANPMVAGLRVRLTSAVGERGRRIRRIADEFAQMTVGDYTLIESVGSTLTSDELCQPLLDSLAAPGPFGFATWDSAGTLQTPFVRTSYADDTFPVYEHKYGSERVGIEIVFVS